MRVGVIGKTGTLGSSFLESAVSHDLELWAPARTEFDLLGEESFKRLSGGEFGQFDWILNFAAYTAVDRAEQDLVACYALNSNAPVQLGKAAASAGARLLHISTDCVFSGDSDRPYREDDAPGPIQVYGQSKLEGEIRLLEACPDAVVLRTSWLFGKSGKSFPGIILNRIEAGQPFKVVSDQIGTPTDASWLSQVILAAVRADLQPGIWHAAGSEVVSRFQWAQEITKAWQAITGKPGPEMSPCISSEFAAPAARPACSALDSSKLAAAIGTLMPAAGSLADQMKGFVRRSVQVSS